MIDTVREVIARAPRCGDTVLHRPSGERWQVAYADAEQGYLAWAGWPDGRALLADCELLERCSEMAHRAAVEQWRSSLPSSDSRRAVVLRLYGAANDGAAA